MNNTGYYLGLIYFISFMWCLLRVEDLHRKGITGHPLQGIGLWSMIPVTNTLAVLFDIVYSVYKGVRK